MGIAIANSKNRCDFSALSVVFVRKSVMPINFPPAILGLEMTAPILWAPGIFWFFLQENPHAHKIPAFRGVLGFFRRGGGSANFIFMGVGIFPTFSD